MQCIDQRPHSNMMRPCLKFKSPFQVAFNMEIENELYLSKHSEYWCILISKLSQYSVTVSWQMLSGWQTTRIVAGGSDKRGQEPPANYISLDHCGSSSPSAGTRTQPPARTSSDRVQLFRQHSSPSHWMPLKCMSKSPNVHCTVSFLPYFSTVKLHEEGQKQIVTIIT